MMDRSPKPPEALMRAIAQDLRPVKPSPQPLHGLSSGKRKYPIQQFQAYWSVIKRYAELTKSDSLIHKSVAAAAHGLVDFLGAERKRVPGDVLRDAERLECSFLEDMTRTSWATNLQDCDARQLWLSGKEILHQARCGRTFPLAPTSIHVSETIRPRGAFSIVDGCVGDFASIEMKTAEIHSLVAVTQGL